MAIAIVPFEVEDEHLVEDRQGQQKYPALQLSKSQPKAGEPVNFILSEKSYKMVPPHLHDQLGLQPVDIYFGSSETPEPCLQITAPIRMVFWGLPVVCHVSKDDKTIKFNEGRLLPGWATVSRVLVSLFANGGLLLREDGSPQMFTFKLKSYDTDLIKKRLPELKETLKKASGKTESLLHIVHCGIELKPVLRKNKEDSSKSSWAVDLNIVDYDPFPHEVRGMLTSIANSEEVQSFLADPFYINQRQQQPAAENRHLLKEVMELASEFFPKDDDPEIGFAQRNKWLSESIAERYNVSDSKQLTAAQIADFHAFIKDCVDRAKAPEPTYDDIPF